MFSPEPRLYVVATPIGNLEDITLRALNVLRKVDFVICEDTRRTLKLLNHYGIKKPLVTYFAPREKEKVVPIIKRLKKGEKAALVSDAGTPLVSDPGTILIKRCVGEEIPVTTVPGPSSLTAAIAISTLPKEQIHFIGFSPRKGLKNFLISISLLEGSLIFFERAERASKFLSIALEILGNREIEIYRELTKLHEEILRGRIKDFLNWESKGELVLIIEGCRDRREQLEIIGPVNFFRAFGLRKNFLKKFTKNT